MPEKYAVLYGENGVEQFRKKERAEDFAQKKANKMRKSVSIDKIRTYPQAKAGETEFSQRQIKEVKPKVKEKIKSQKPAKKKVKQKLEKKGSKNPYVPSFNDLMGM